MTILRCLRCAIAIPVALLALPDCHAAAEVVVFEKVPVRFAPNAYSEGLEPGITATADGRMVTTQANLPEHEGPVRILAHLTVEPVPKDEQSVYDKWDRAGNIQLVREGEPELELIKFITAYGGRTEYRVDVTDLRIRLQGPVTFRAFIDTWVDSAWRVSLAIDYEYDSTASSPVWVGSLLYDQTYTSEDPGEAGRSVTAEVPAGMQRVTLQYLTSGHCTDGRDADEFVSKDHVIRVDDDVVYRYQPWRDDCEGFRAINPYCKRWSDGSWSSDYSRSGWCPGDVVAPLELDLTDHLTPGRHTVHFTIESVRPEDEDGHHGYWRVSARLLGLKDPQSTAPDGR